MNLNNIKEGSIILSENYLHSTIRKYLLKNRKGIGNIKICSFSVFFQSFNTKQDPTFMYYSLLKENANAFLYNKESIVSYSFIQEIMNYIKDLKTYHIPYSLMKEDTIFEKENKKIVELLYPITLPIEDTLSCIQEKLEKEDFSNIYIIDEASDVFKEEIYSKMIQKGATRLSFDNTLETKQMYSALNKRQEVESLAQYIIQQDINVEEAKLSILDNDYIPYIHQIFDKYHIPYSFLQESVQPSIVHKYIAFLEYYVNPSIEHLMQLFYTNAFTHPYQDAFIEYIDLYNKHIEEDFTIFNNISISEDIINDIEFTSLKKLEEKAQIVKEYISPILTSILNSDFINACMKIDEYLCHNHTFINKEERSALLSIRSTIQDNYPYMKEKQDIPFFIAYIKNQKIVMKTDEQGLIISDFNHPLPNYTYHFVLGCTQNNYPAFKGKTGIFEETYYTFLPYPTLENRYTHHMKNRKKVLTTAKHLVCFTPLSTIDGKVFETSLELDVFMKPVSTIRYPLIQNEKQEERKEHITQEEAIHLFTKNNKIYGSISSLERYTNCPYAYFLRYGLKLTEPNDYSFNNAKNGTFIHYVMETLTKRYKKEYVNASEEVVNEILEEKIQELLLVYPNKEKEYALIKKRMLPFIMYNLEVLKNFESKSSISCSSSEQSFHYDFAIDDIYAISLKGIIDRIDTNQDFLRVIDYKSSAHTLVEEKVFAGLQLQLITYLIVAQELLKKRSLGAFYYSFAQPSTAMTYGKVYKRPLHLEVFNEDTAYDEMLKNKRFNGWISDEYIEVMDQDATTIKGVRNYKNGGISAATIYDFDVLKSYMEEVYRKIGKQILSGNIECKNALGACTYCPYACICQKGKFSYDKEELITVTSQLYKKGGRKDA